MRKSPAGTSNEGRSPRPAARAELGPDPGRQPPGTVPLVRQRPLRVAPLPLGLGVAQEGGGGPRKVTGEGTGGRGISLP